MELPRYAEIMISDFDLHSADMVLAILLDIASLSTSNSKPMYIY